MSSASLLEHEFLSGYNLFSIPNLSTLRVPTNSTIHTSIHLHRAVSDVTVVLVTLARCLGAYSQVNDVLLSLILDDLKQFAVRIQWMDRQCWADVMQTVVMEEIFEDETCRKNGIDNSESQCPFTAILSLDKSYSTSHPLLFILSEDRYQLELHLSTLYFHESTASILAAQVQSLLSDIISHPNGSCTDITAALSKNLQSCHVNKPSKDIYTHIPSVDIVTDYIHNAVKNIPSSKALEYHRNLSDTTRTTQEDVLTLTYKELHLASNKFAHYLVAQGVQGEDRIALCMPRNLDFHIILLGIMKAGCCYVPIDPELPSERQNFITKDSSPRFTFTEESATNGIKKSNSCLDEDINLARRDNLAYILYTSGTTGTPKGCLLTHRGLSEATLALSTFSYETAAEDGRYLAVASIAFDVHLAETFVALSLGMTLITASRNTLFENLPYYLKKLRITHVGIVPSLIEATMSAVEESSASSAASASEDNGDEMCLRFIASGGEKMTDAILERWGNHPQVRLANFYGPSEVTIGCAARFMSRNTRRENVGRIFGSCSAYVVDQGLKVVMRGQPGELLVSGPLVGRGYLGQDDLTQKAFVHWEGMWVYRTGDLVRMMPDDTIEILGRTDSQIKLNGVRIEAEGISSILRNAAFAFSTHELKIDLEVTTLLARHPSMHNDQLISYISYNRSVDISTRRSRKPQLLPPHDIPPNFLKSLREECIKQLPSYMRPAHIVPLEFIPLSSNGKADNKMLVLVYCEMKLERLIELSSDGRSSSGDKRQKKISIETDLEEKLINLIAKYSSKPTELITPSSNLFTLGYDSIKMIQLSSGIRKSFPDLSEPLSVSELMLFPTAEQLGLIVETRQRQRRTNHERSGSYSTADFKLFANKWQTAVRDEIDADSERIEDIYPTFPLQDGVLYRSMDSYTLYIEHVTLLCRSDISLDKLKWCWQQAMMRYEILRAIFLFHEQVIQVILRSEACELPWHAHKISSMNDCDFVNWFHATDADRISKDIVDKISSSPPFRLNVFVSDECNYVTLSIHHSIYDGISLSILFRSIERLYFDVPPHSECKISDALRYVHSINLEKAEIFCKDYFKDFDWTKNPFGLGDTSTSFSRKIVRRSVPFTMQLSELNDLAIKAQCTIEALLAASYAVGLDHYVYHSRDIVFGIIRSGRSSVDDNINNAIYPLLSVQPVRISTASSDYILPSARSAIASAIKFEHAPLTKIRQWLQPSGELFEMAFSVSFKTPDKTRLYGIVESVQPDSDYVLAVEIVLDESSGNAVVNAAFNEEDISEEIVTNLLGSLESTVISLTNNEDMRSPLNTDEMQHGLIFPRFSKMHRISGKDISMKEFGKNDVELEDRLRTIIAKFFNVGDTVVTPSISFLSLGLDSIKAIGLSRRLRKADLKVTAVDLMRYTTIRTLVNHCLGSNTQMDQHSTEGLKLLKKAQEMLADNLDLPSLKLSEEDETIIYPTTDLQAGMLTQTITSNGQLYVHAFVFQLSSLITVSDLKQICKTAVEALSIFRTSFQFAFELGSWAQIVHSDAPFYWTETELDNFEDVNAYVANYMQSVNLKKEEDFAKPPIRFNYMHSKHTGMAYILLVMHHALYDGISIRKLSEFIEAIYKGKHSTTERPKFQDFLPYFRRQELYGTSFWVNYLSGYDIPDIQPREFVSNDLYYTSESAIPISFAQLDDCCKEFRVTSQCFGQAAWAKVLAILLHADDVVFGHVVSGRHTALSEDIIGPMLSTIPCRVTLSSEQRNIDLLQHIHDRNVAALDWQHPSLRSVHKELAKSSIWFSLFLFLPLLDESVDEDRLWHPIELQSEDAKIQYPISVELRQNKDCLIVKAACQSKFMERKDLESLVNLFCNTLSGLIKEPYAGSSKDMIKAGTSRLLTFSLMLSKQVPNKTDIKETSVWPQEFLGVRNILASMTGLQSVELKLNKTLSSLGIDSISAIQLSGKFRGLGYRISAADILHCDALSDIIDILSNTDPDEKNPHENGTTLQLPFIPTKNSTELTWLPSAGIKWLIGAWQHSGHARYQHAFAFRLPSDIDQHSLQEAWSQLVIRHPILRSSFGSTETGSLYMITNKTIPQNHLWTVKDFGKETLTSETVGDFMISLVSNPSYREQIGPRAFFLHDDTISKYFIVKLHHFQYDAWSLQLLFEDLEDLYHQKQPLNDNNYDEFLTFFTGPSAYQEQKLYWKTYLPNSFKPSYFPQLVDKADINSFRGNREFYTDSEALINRRELKRLALNLGISLDMIFLASWAILQASYTNDWSATFGIWHLGRSGGPANISTIAMPCLNILPLHIPNLEPKSSLPKTAVLIQNHLRQRSPVIEQSDLEMIDKWINAGGKPLCNVFINIIKTKPDQNIAEKILTPVDVPYFIPDISTNKAITSLSDIKIADLIKDDLVIDIAASEHEDNISMTMEYERTLLSRAQAQSLIVQWASIIKQTLPVRNNK